MSPRHLALACLITLMFAGCTRIQLQPLPDGMTSQPPADWATRSLQLSRFNHWELAGKLAVRQPSDSGTAIINRWQQQGEHYQLALSSSFLGMGSTHLSGQPGYLELTLTNGDTYRSAEPENLVLAATGWQLPVNSLSWWVRGLPAPEGHYRLLYDDQQQLAMIEQGGWEIRYDRWQHFIEDLPLLPARITALKDSKRVRIVITDWQRKD